MVSFAHKMAHANLDVQVTNLVLKDTLVNNPNAWNLVMTILIVVVLISIAILIIKYAMRNVPMLIVVVKDIIVQVLANVWTLVNIVKIAIMVNTVMKMESIAKLIVDQIKIV